MIKKLVLVFVLAVSLLMSGIATIGMTSTLTQDIASVSAPMFSYNPAERGTTVGVYTQVRNTTEHRHNYRAQFFVTSDCDGTTYVLGSNNGTTLRLDAGRGVNLSTVFIVPSTACAGAYTVTVSVSAGNANTSAQSVLTVTE